jgi:hypothetical protein
LSAEIHRLGGDPTDDVWRWFVLNGPHGRDFSWGQTRREPPGYVGVEHLERIVAEMAESDSSFLIRAREVVLKAFGSMDLDVLRRAIQVAAVVGGDVELERVTILTTHKSKVVAADARASVFYLKRQLRARRERGSRE